MSPPESLSGSAWSAGSVHVWIGLGSNLEGPERQVGAALVALDELPKSRLEAVSRLYRTAPVGPPGQPDYINAAARLETRLAPDALLGELHRIERARGRVRDGSRWGPRILDLDILVYGDLRLDQPGLTIPHPEMARRAFVLIPLADVASLDLDVPGFGILGDLLDRCDPRGVEFAADADADAVMRRIRARPLDPIA